MTRQMTTKSRRSGRHEYLIKAASQLVAKIEKIKREQELSHNGTDLLFRGQPCDRPLLPKLGRCKVRGNLQRIEQLLLEEFERTSLPLREFEPEDKWDLLALAQHYGLPTRLLDWTYSALAALWFAVRNPPQSKHAPGEFENGVVWVLSAPTE